MQDHYTVHFLVHQCQIIPLDISIHEMENIIFFLLLNNYLENPSFHDDQSLQLSSGLVQYFSMVYIWSSVDSYESKYLSSILILLIFFLALCFTFRVSSCCILYFTMKDYLSLIVYSHAFWALGIVFWKFMRIFPH